MSDKNGKTRRMSVKEQAANGQMYHMCLRFSARVGLKEINEFLRNCGSTDAPYTNETQMFRLEQTVPFIPDDDMLRSYEKTIAKSINEGNGALCVQYVKFDGYEYIYAVRNATLEDERFEKLSKHVISLGHSAICDFLGRCVEKDAPSTELAAAIRERFDCMSPEQKRECFARYELEYPE